MLVLSRQVNQSIMIGDDVEISVVDIKGDKVRIGINAPANVAVHRKEVWLAIRTENENAVQAADVDTEALKRLLQQKAKSEGADGAPRG